MTQVVLREISEFAEDLWEEIDAIRAARKSSVDDESAAMMAFDEPDDFIKIGKRMFYTDMQSLFMWHFCLGWWTCLAHVMERLPYSLLMDYRRK